MSGNTHDRNRLPTVGGMRLEGNVTPRARVGIDDLLLAIEVIEAYEPENETEDAIRLATVAAFLEAEVKRRRADAFARDLTAEVAKAGHNVNDPRIRARIQAAAKRQVAS